jgi:3-hydroxymyristoyl/3-hydroxydecanoyl-(acyl carrier protein) dehydratase
MMIDAVKKITDNTIEIEKYLSINEEIFESHFPGNPVLPAAFMVEGAIQAARILVWKKTNFQNSLLGYEFNKFKFQNLLCPSSILHINVSFKDIGQLGKAKTNVVIRAEGYTEEKEVFAGEIVCKVVSSDLIHNVEQCKEFLNYLLKNRR